MTLKSNLTIVFLSFFCLSCIEEVPDHTTPTAAIEMEAEGGEADVSLDGGDWKITGVINQNGAMHIHGNSFTPEGEIIRKNYKLSLEGLGRLEALWLDKGFIIHRQNSASFKITLEENATGEEFSFIVVLQSGDQVKEITVSQKKSQGYRFGHITYYLDEDDGDSLFTLKSTIYRFDIQTEQDFSFTPFGGVNVERQSYFESPQSDAFVWLEESPVRVKIPTAINDREIGYSGKEDLYSDLVTRSPHGFEGSMVTVAVPAGRSEVWAEVEYRIRRTSYAMFLTNNRTEEQKTIGGRWVEVTPTGNYAVQIES